jgi:hypothetical protein
MSVAFLLATDSCVGGDSASTGVATMQSVSHSSETGETWVSLRRDPRPCDSAEGCAWFVHALNLHELDRHVDRIDLTLPNGALNTEVADAADGDVVLLGVARGSTLVASEAFRGLPGHEPQDSDVFVQASSEPTAHSVNRSREHRFVTALNTGASVGVPEIDFSSIEDRWLDRVWLRDSVYEHAAIVSGRFMGEPGGRGIVRFEVSQVFVPLTERASPCPHVPAHKCARGTVATFARRADRCLVQTACRSAGACPD